MCSVYRGGGGGGGGGGVQYIGRYHEYIGGYHEYIRGCSVHWRVTMMQVGGYYDLCGRTSSGHREMFSTLRFSI